MDMEIRQVRPDELVALDAVARLTREVYVGEGFIDAESDYVLELTDTARRAHDAEVWVAVVDDEVLGSVTFCPVGSLYREIGRNDEGEFRMLVVSPAARGRGIGQTLVELCLTRATEMGYAGIRMSTMDRMTSAHRVYERLGFTRAPQDDWSPAPGVDLLAYSASLVPPE